MLGEEHHINCHTLQLINRPPINGIAERIVGMLKTTVRQMLKQVNLGREWWSYACRFAGHMMREKVLGREWPYPLFGQLVGIWKSHDKAQAKSLDDRGCVGYLLDIDIWQSGTTRIMQDGVVVKGLAPRRILQGITSILSQISMSLRKGCHGGPFKMSLGSSSGSTILVVSIMGHPSPLNLTLRRSMCSLQA